MFNGSKCSNSGTPTMNKPSANTERELIASDVRLADDLFPVGAINPIPRTILVTGATGFLGRYLVKKLLLDARLQLLCLVRAQSQGEAEQKLLRSLQFYDASLTCLPPRITVLCGRVTSPEFALAHDAYLQLANQVDLVYHCAGEVNWVRTYRHLRQTNVLGTLEVIRFACAGQHKQVVFFSTLAVCFIQNRADKVDESTHLLPHIEHMAMGYAKSKCVAESLCARVAAHGLAVTVLRVGLIAGDSVHGVSNPTDLLGAAIQGAVASAYAVDLDWFVDVLPVDFVVDAVLALPPPKAAALQVWHLHHPQPRHWREMVLWLNLYGYPITLLATEAWLAQTYGAAADRSNPLYSFKRFFLTPIPGLALRPFEVYLALGQGRIDSRRSWVQLGSLQAPPLESGLIHRYLHHYQVINKLPRRSAHPGADGYQQNHGEQNHVEQNHGEQAAHEMAFNQSLAAMLQGALQEAVEVLEIRTVAFQSHNGILNELAAARMGASVGVRVLDLSLRRGASRHIETRRVLVKTKTSDHEMQALLAHGAQVADARLGQCFRDHTDPLGLHQSHLRELALYQWPDARLRSITPHCLGVLAGEANGLWTIVLEYIEQIDLTDISHSVSQWQPSQIEICIDGMAQLHGMAYTSTANLPPHLHLNAQRRCAEMQAMQPLLLALADFSESYFQPWLGESLRPLQQQLIDSLAQWWPQLLALPTSLIHNDFNPRNFALCSANPARPICVFDWELACIDLPQHDLAELLCFTLPAGTTDAQLLGYLERHAQALARLSAIEIDRGDWLHGFLLALQHLMILRIPSYCLFHRFKAQGFLQRVVCNWWRIYKALSPIRGRRFAPPGLARET